MHGVKAGIEELKLSGGLKSGTKEPLAKEVLISTSTSSGLVVIVEKR